ncbi:LpqB family beta-propeller domain-containing protein [Neomicrococcus lactis]|uniref:LpqB family beta-propeller domain-containing protein n=1 Tax=Neomicrococcus lactis TaxID=732241 RepID=UPI002300D433|nr:LpqB family beta-propeller domain-containing protein [Neomicrococcus lactis]
MKAKQLLAIVTVVLVAFLTACANIPTSGSLGVSTTAPTQGTDGSLAFSAAGPRDGMSPEEVIEGFYKAGVDTNDDYKTAREYLTTEFAGIWNPSSKATVYDADPAVVENVQEGSYGVSVEVSSTVDDKGIRTTLPEHSSQLLTLQLAQVNGQWRISQAPDGLLIESGNFESLFSPHTLYFYDSTFAYAVPDVRWFANKQGLAATVVSALLNGAAPYLNNAVFSAFPPGTKLAQPSVPIESGEARVDFASSVFAEASDLRRKQMRQQLSLTLTTLGNVSSVTMTVEQRPVDLGPTDPEFKAAQVNASVPNTQIAIADKKLVYFQGNGHTPIGNIPDISAYNPVDPAMSPVGSRYAFLSGDRKKVITVDDAGRVRVAGTGVRLTQPSVDYLGWTWTANHAGGAHVQAVPPNPAVDGEIRDIAAEWLQNAEVTSLRVSRDGARLLVAATIDGVSGIYVAGLIRDSEGVPRGVQNPVKIEIPQHVTRAVWEHDDSIIAWNPATEAPVAPVRVTLASVVEEFSPLLGLTNLSAGAGDRRNIYAENPEGIYVRSGNSWRKLEGKAAGLSYPG